MENRHLLWHRNYNNCNQNQLAIISSKERGEFNQIYSIDSYVLDGNQNRWHPISFNHSTHQMNPFNFQQPPPFHPNQFPMGPRPSPGPSNNSRITSELQRVDRRIDVLEREINEIKLQLKIINLQRAKLNESPKWWTLPHLPLIHSLHCSSLTLKWS